MKLKEDSRIKESRKSLALSWIYFSLYLVVIMVLSYSLGEKPYLFGLPLWVAIANVLIPFLFVFFLIIIVEMFISDLSLTDEHKRKDKK